MTRRGNSVKKDFSVFPSNWRWWHDEMFNSNGLMPRFDVLFEGVKDVVIHFEGCAWDVYFILFFVSWENIVETGEEAISFRWTGHLALAFNNQLSSSGHWETSTSGRNKYLLLSLFHFFFFYSFYLFLLPSSIRESTNPGERQSE